MSSCAGEFPLSRWLGPRPDESTYVPLILATVRPWPFRTSPPTPISLARSQPTPAMTGSDPCSSNLLFVGVTDVPVLSRRVEHRPAGQVSG